MKFVNWLRNKVIPYKYVRPNDSDLPVIPPLPPRRPEPDHNPAIAKCGECGLVIHEMMMYCCKRENCPVFTQPRL